MASEDDAQEKTEEPSQRRLEKAREDGQILSSKDMFVFSTTLAGLFLVLGMLVFIGPWIGKWKGFFVWDSSDALGDLLVSRTWDAFVDFLAVSLIVAVPILVVVILTQAVVGMGLNFAASALAFKGNRINPLSGLQRMFSLRSLVELGKAVLKVAVLGGASFLLLYESIPGMLTLASTSMDRAIGVTFANFTQLLIVATVLMGAIGLIDYMWSRHQHMQKLRMSRQDLKEENKQSEGSPEVKARIRRLQFEASRRAAQQGAALENVKDATAIITNPTHFAVALRYVPGEQGAPIIVAMGRGRMAERIIERGEDFDISVFRSPLLARALFFTGEIGQEISERLFGAVAAVLAYVYRLDQGDTPDYPNVELPDDLKFDQNGRPIDEDTA